MALLPVFKNLVLLVLFLFSESSNFLDSSASDVFVCLLIANVDVYRSIFGFQGTIPELSFSRSEPRGARAPVWAHSVSLAATPEIILYFLFLRLLRCFSSPGSLPEVMDWLRDD